MLFKPPVTIIKPTSTTSCVPVHEIDTFDVVHYKDTACRVLRCVAESQMGRDKLGYRVEDKKKLNYS